MKHFVVKLLIIAMSGISVAAMANDDGVYQCDDVPESIYEQFGEDNASVCQVDGLIAVKKDKKWGFVNEMGKLVIPYGFDHVDDFFQGVAVVNRNEKYAIIDKKGKPLTEFVYDYIEPDYSKHQRLYVEKNGKHGLINLQGKEVVPLIYDGIGTWLDEDSGIADNGLVNVRKNDKEGYINLQGKVVIPLKYDLTSRFEGKTAVVGQIVERHTDGDVYRYGIIDQTGKTLVPIKFSYLASWFSDGLAMASLKGDKYGFINSQGKMVIAEKYQESRHFSEKLAAVSEDGKKWGYINSAGKMVIPAQYDEAYDFADGMAAVGKGDKMGIIDKTNKTLIPFKYNWIDVINKDYILVKNEEEELLEFSYDELLEDSKSK